MKKPTSITFLGKIAIALFIVSAPLIVLDRYTPLSINNTVVHFILFYLAVTAVPIIIAVYWLGFKTTQSFLAIMFSTLAICFLFAFLRWGGDWKTQTIIYRNNKNPALTIEYRMRGDRFAFGYKRQIVRREKALPFIDWITNIDTSKIDARQWKRTDERVNEMKISGEYVDLPSY